MNEQKVQEVLNFLEEYRPMPGSAFDKARTMLEEALASAPELRLYTGQPVLVSMNNVTWESGYLQAIGSRGDPKYSVNGFWFMYCKPDVGAISKPNWIEVGEQTICVEFDPQKEVLLYLHDDNTGGITNHRPTHLDSGVARFCVLPIPEWVGEERD